MPAGKGKNRVEIPGLDEFRVQLKDLPKDVQKFYKDEIRQVAEKVAADAGSRVPTDTGTAAAGIAAKGYVTGPAIVESRDPKYLRWLDFGSRTPVTGNPRKVGPWHGSGTGPKGGRFVYPAIKANAFEIVVGTRRAVEKAAERAGFK